MRTDVGRTGPCPSIGVEVSGSAPVFEAWVFSEIYLC